MAGLHREACGRSGCDFVAGPSRDLNRVQRIADQHRATAHVLDLAAIEAADRPAVRPGSAREQRQRTQERAERVVAHLASYRVFQRGEPGYSEPRGVYGDRETRRARKAERDERAAAFVDLTCGLTRLTADIWGER